MNRRQNNEYRQQDIERRRSANLSATIQTLSKYARRPFVGATTQVGCGSLFSRSALDKAQMPAESGKPLNLGVERFPSMFSKNDVVIIPLLTLRCVDKVFDGNIAGLSSWNAA